MPAFRLPNKILPVALGILQAGWTISLFLLSWTVCWFSRENHCSGIWQLQDTLTVVFFSPSYFHLCHGNRKATLPVDTSWHSRDLFFLTTWKTDLLCPFKQVPQIVWRQRHWGKRYFSVCLYMYKLPTHQRNILCNNPSRGSCVAISYANLAIFSRNHFGDKPFFLKNVQKTLIWGAEVVLF